MIRRTFLYTTAALVVMVGTVRAQSQRILVQGSGAPTVHTSIAAAISAAQAGDKIYLSGGTFTEAAPLIFDKPLHLVGAGIHPDSSGVTGTTTIGTSGASNNDIQITTAASGSTFTGIIFSPYNNGAHMHYGTTEDDDDPTGLIFQRCEFTRGLSLGFAEGSRSSSTFDECLFRGSGNTQFTGRGGQAVVTRSVFDGCGMNIFRPSGLFLKNSVVLGEGLTNSQNAIVQNCVFTNTNAPLWQVRGVHISNCLLTSPTMFSNSLYNSETNNIYGVAAASIFVNETDNVFQFSDDLHLAPGSGGIGMGNDGNDIGIYGTHSPAKPGIVPYNPHYQQAVIDPATNMNGELPVQIRTAAQSH